MQTQLSRNKHLVVISLYKKISFAVPFFCFTVLVMLCSFSSRLRSIDVYALCALFSLLFGIFIAPQKKRYIALVTRHLVSGSLGIVILIVSASYFLSAIFTVSDLASVVEYLVSQAHIAGRLFPMVAFVMGAFVAISASSGVASIMIVTPLVITAAPSVGASAGAAALGVLSGVACGDYIGVGTDSTILASNAQGIAPRDSTKPKLFMLFVALLFTALVLSLFSAGTAASTSQSPAYAVPSLLSWSIFTIAALGFGATFFFKQTIFVIITMLFASLICLAVLAPDLFLQQLSAGSSLRRAIPSLGALILFYLSASALGGLFERSGALARIFSVRRLGRWSFREGEASVIILSNVLSLFIPSNAVLIIMTSRILRPVKRALSISPQRMASLISAGGNSLHYIIPWHLGTVIWIAQATRAARLSHVSMTSPSLLIFLGPYSWGLILAAVISIALPRGFIFWERREADL